MSEIFLKGKMYLPIRLRLRKWLEFEKSQELLMKSISDKNIESYASNLYILIANALSVSIEEIFNAPWYEIIQAYSAITDLNKVREIPLLKSDPSKPKEIPWEYDGRDWFWWVHMFAKNYGWTIPSVEELDINDALSLLQEVLVDQQLEKEWQWGLSEIAYPYNEGTKKQEFHKLDRPMWMEGKQANLPAMKVRFKKSMLPVGKIIGEDGNERIVN
jgi:hypothetical protein